MPGISLAEYGDTLFDRGIPGLDADINISSIVNYINGETKLDFGVAVALDEDGRLKLPEGGDEIVGVTVRHAVYAANEVGDVGFPPTVAVPVMEFGRIWAICADGCEFHDAAATDAAGALGVGKAIPVAGAFWDDKVAAGESALLRLNRQLAAGAAAGAAEPASSEPAGASASASKSKSAKAAAPSGDASTDTKTGK